MIFSCVCAILLILSDAHSKALEAILKLCLAIGYGALAWEAAQHAKYTEALICNGMMAIYLTASLQFGFPYIGEVIVWSGIWPAANAQPAP
jgi:hypothetical protein